MNNPNDQSRPAQEIDAEGDLTPQDLEDLELAKKIMEMHKELFKKLKEYDEQSGST